MMKSKKFCYILILVLIVLNIFSWRFWWEKPPFPGDRGPEFGHKKKGSAVEFLTDKLGLDTLQQKEISVLMHDYFDHIGEINSKIGDSRDIMAQMVCKGNEDGLDSVIDNLSTLKTDLEYATFQHFKSIRNICRDDQKMAFDTLMFGMMRRFDGEHRRPKPEFDKNHKPEFNKKNK